MVVVGSFPVVRDLVGQRRAEARAAQLERSAPRYALTGLSTAQRILVSTVTSSTAERAAIERWGAGARTQGERLAAVDLRRFLGVIVQRGDPATRMVALTFDDGPSANTLRIVEDLEVSGAKATFFFVGSRARGHWQQQQRVLAAGLEIGSHTWDHARLMNLSQSSFDAQTVKTADSVQRDTSFRPRLLRAMHGDIDSADVAMARALGLVVVNWSVHGNDTGAGQTMARIAANGLSAGSGDIVLLHETNPLTVKAVPYIIKGLQAKGLRLVTVSELLAASRTVATQRAPGSRRVGRRH
jgi:peptidoglycan/xylan/chitin deacetylase (PgdA/CDA1 family)